MHVLHCQNRRKNVQCEENLHSFTCISFLSRTCHVSCPFYCAWFDHTLIIFGREYKSWCYLLCNSLQPFVLPPSYAEIFSLAPYSWTLGHSSSLSSSLCSFLHFSVILSLLGSNILLSILFSKHPQPTVFLQYERSCFTPIHNNRQNYKLIFIFLYSKLVDKRFFLNRILIH